MKRFCILLFLGGWGFLPLISCADREKEALQGMPLEELMHDILLTNASAPEDEEDTTRYLNLYADVYERVGIDSLQMDLILQYMSHHPAELSVIMDRVIARMQRQYDSLEVSVSEPGELELLEDTVK